MPSNVGTDKDYPGVTSRQRMRIVDRIDLEYGASSWGNNPDFMAKYHKHESCAST